MEFKDGSNNNLLESKIEEPPPDDPKPPLEPPPQVEPPPVEDNPPPKPDETFGKKVNHQTLFSVDKPVEFYLIGEIVGGTGFPDGVSCAYKIIAGSQWMLQEGKPEEELCSGQTQGDIDGFRIWNHPIDLHFITSSPSDSPKILFQVWRLDNSGRGELESYGFCFLPFGVGSFDLKCQTWRPLGTSQQELSRRFVGGVPRLYDWSTLYKNAFNERTYVTSVGSGTIHIKLNVIAQNLERYHVEY